MTELERRVSAYRTTMSVVKALLTSGTITTEEYAKIDTIMTKKYGISLDSIFR